MASYRAKFFRKLLSSNGHGFKCLQYAVDIHDAGNADAAIEAAWRQYERLTKRVGTRHGDWVEIEPMENAVDAGAPLQPITTTIP